MEHTSRISLAASPAAVAAVLRDLSTYPHWNDVVTAADVDSSDDAAWLTTLRAQVGPFARSKQLRMVRTRDDKEDGTHEIRFERRERDGRSHAEWTMTAHVQAVDDGSLVLLGLAYSGGLWSSALDPVLGSAIDRATRRLPDYLGGRETS